MKNSKIPPNYGTLQGYTPGYRKYGTDLDMVWYGMAWHGMVWYMEWYGMVWYGMVWYGVG